VSKPVLSRLAAIMLTSVVAHVSYADDTAAPPAEAAKPDNEVSFNIGGTSDYRYRGISQTTMKPAIQGGADYTNNPTGLYAGTWLSSIRWVEDSGGNHNVEWDIYAGKRGQLFDKLNYDVGILRYLYPGNNLATIPTFANADTTEVYGQLSYELLNVKYSHSTTNIFAFPDSENSSYVDLWTSIDLVDGYALGLHAGHQHVQNSSDWSYTDWKIGVAKDFFDVSWTLGVVGTNANKTLYVTSDGRFTGRTSLVLSGSKSF
jgi:uncharacterized protein (TIGR02001 family)